MRVYQFRHIREWARGEDIARIAATGGSAWRSAASTRRQPVVAARCSGRFASLGRAACAPLSSRGLGRRPLMAETRVRIPVAVLVRPRSSGLSRFRAAAEARNEGWSVSAQAPDRVHRQFDRIRDAGQCPRCAVHPIRPGHDERRRVNHHSFLARKSFGMAYLEHEPRLLEVVGAKACDGVASEDGVALDAE